MSFAIFDTNTIHFLKQKDLYGAGSNSNNTIGKIVTDVHGNFEAIVDPPTRVAEGTDFTFVTGGNNLTVAIDAEGRVWTSGTSANLLGRPAPTTIEKRTLSPVTSQPEKMTKAQTFSNGFMTLGESGRLYAIGINHYNIMGKTEADLGKTFKEFTSVVPHKRFIDFSAAYRNLYAIDDEGNVWGWGYKTATSLGSNPTGYVKSYAWFGDTMLSDGVMKFQKVVSGVYRCIALREDGRVGGVGTGVSAMLRGDGVLGTTYSDFRMSDDEELRFKKIYINESLLFGIKEDDTLWVDGSGTSQVEGLNKVPRSRKLTQIGDKRWDQLSPRSNGMYGLQKDGSLWTWGGSENGMNFARNAESVYFYAPRKVEITGVTKLKGNTEELIADEIRYVYEEQKISIAIRNKGIGLETISSFSEEFMDARYVFKNHGDTGTYFLTFDGVRFRGNYASGEEAFEKGHTWEYIKENEQKILELIHESESRRLYIVMISALKSKTNDHFLKEVRQIIEEESPHDGAALNRRIFFPGNSKNIINKELVEFQ